MQLSANRRGMQDEVRLQWWKQLLKDMVRNKFIYVMALPVIAYYIVFQYLPMYGLVMAFQDYKPARGFFGSEFVGLGNFMEFFKSIHFYRIVSNTVIISAYQIIFGFPAPILLALLLNEVRSRKFKRTVQTVTYLPHFISVMVVCGIILDFTSTNGIINDMIDFLGGNRIQFMVKPEWFRFIYVGTNIWESVGWGSIIYLAALTGINPELYEAATIDGANRWKQLLHVTVPGIMPTVMIMLILRLGHIMSVGFEKIILLYNPLTFETADVISTYVYRKGIGDRNYGFASAVGMFNSVINFMMLILANRLSKYSSQSSLW